MSDDGDDFLENDAEDHNNSDTPSVTYEKELGEDIDRQIQGILLGLGSDETEVRIHVRRILEGTGTSEKCFSAFASEGSASIEKTIIKDWGPGAYKIYVHGNKGRLITRFVTRIGKPLSDDDNKNDHFKYVMDMQLRQSERMDMLQQRHSEKMEAILLAFIDKDGNSSRSTRAPLDIPALISAGAGAVALIAELLPKRESLADRIKELEAIQGIQGNKDEGNDNSQAQLIAAVSPLLGQLLAGFQQQPAAQQQQQPKTQQPETQPQQIQPQQPQSQHQQVQSEEEKMYLFKIQVKGLVDKAKNDCDHELYADVIMDVLPKHQIKGFFSQGDPIQQLININPEVANHREWFKKLIIEVQNLVAADDDVHDKKEAEEIEKINASKNNETNETNEPDETK